MLPGQVEIGVGDLLGKHQPVVLHAAGFPQFLEALRAQHLPQRVGCIYGPIDQNVGDVDALRRKLRVERLAKHSTPAHGGRVRVLATIATYGGRC